MMGLNFLDTILDDSQQVRYMLAYQKKALKSLLLKLDTYLRSTVQVSKVTLLKSLIHLSTAGQIITDGLEQERYIVSSIVGFGTKHGDGH